MLPDSEPRKSTKKVRPTVRIQRRLEHLRKLQAKNEERMKALMEREQLLKIDDRMVKDPTVKNTGRNVDDLRSKLQRIRINISRKRYSLTFKTRSIKQLEEVLGQLQIEEGQLQKDLDAATAAHENAKKQFLKQEKHE